MFVIELLFKLNIHLFYYFFLTFPVTSHSHHAVLCVIEYFAESLEVV